MFVRVPKSVRNRLSAALVGLMTAALAACSQQAAPEEVVEPASPVVEEHESVVKPEKKPTRPTNQENRQPAEKAVEKQQVAPEPPPAPEPSPVSVEAPAPAPTFSPVEPATPFVPSAPGKRIAQVSVPGSYVAVTFDDGPSATLTPQVLDIFKRHGARATFFVLGRNANRNRSILARAVSEGHEVGAHTWSHINMRASSEDTIKRELDRTNAVIEEASGQRVKVMRPPYGATNKQLVNMVYNRYGTPSILWDVDTNDWRKPGVQKVVNRAVGKAKPGSIILLHDIHPSTLEAVEDIVTGLQARGFKLVTVSELIAMGRQAAGVTAPAMEADIQSSPQREEEPAAAVAEASAPLHAQQQQQQLPEGAASIGTVPAPVVAPVETTPAPQNVVPMPQETDFNFYES